MVAVRTTPTTAGEERFRLGSAIVVDPVRNIILRDGRPHPVEPRVMQLLLHLCARPGDTVSKQELMAQVWQANVVDEAIHRAISLLRSALGDSAGESRIIGTVPRRGYRLLLAPVPVHSRRSLLPLAAAAALVVVAVAMLVLIRNPEVKQPAPPPAAVQVAIPAPVADTVEQLKRAARGTGPGVIPTARASAPEPTPRPDAIAPLAPTPQGIQPHEAPPAPESATAPRAPTN